MTRGKPLFMKTYGRQKRKISAWISPDIRRQAFESTASSETDASVFEPAKPAKTSKRRTSVASHRVGRHAKKKAMQCLKEMDSDEENICVPSPPRLHPAQQDKTTRERKLASTAAGLLRPSAKQVLMTSESEDDCSSAPKRCKIMFGRKRNSSIDPPSVGRFVTRRRGAGVSKPKFSKPAVSVLNSSDDFVPGRGASGSSRILGPSRRRPLKSFLMSSAENSVTAAGNASSSINPLREISLNESADHSLGPCARKPLFCSTPSARPLGQRPRLKPFPISDQCSTSPSISVSHIDVVSTFQEDLDSSEQPLSPPSSAPVRELSSGGKQQSALSEPQKAPGTHDCAESFNHFVNTQRGTDRSSCSERDKSSKEAETPNGAKALLSSETEDSSNFVSASGELKWLVEALKDNCLTQRCSVQLERVDKLIMTLLHCQTTYSSCLDHLSSVHSQQISEHLLSVQGSHTVDPSRSLHLTLSMTGNETCDSLQFVNSCESTDAVPSVTDSQSFDISQSAEHTTNESTDQPMSVDGTESIQHTDSIVEVITHVKSPDNSLSIKQTLPATKKCTVQLERLAMPQLTVLQQHEFIHHTEPSLEVKFVPPQANKSDSDHPDGHTWLAKTDERKMASDAKSVHHSNSLDPGTKEREPSLTAKLMEKCLTEKQTVAVKKSSLPNQKETLQLKDTTLKSSTDDSDSASDGQFTKMSSRNDHMSERDRRMKADQRGLKARQDKSKRRMSTDRPGTTRKVCVSGLSVSRWKNKSNTSAHVFQSRDCSITELMPTQHKQPKELLGTSGIFCTPAKVNRLNLSSLLADLTPNTHTWSRLKAALSVHRKTKVSCSGRSFPQPLLISPGGGELADLSQDLFATPLRAALPERFRSQLLKSTSVAVCEDTFLSDAEKVYAECNQEGPLPWEECILPQRIKQCVKIGEGTFGEVFSTTNSSGDTVALKIIPLEGNEKVNGEDQKSFGEILHEIIISKELSRLKEKPHNQSQGFIGLNDLHCVRGCYPPALLKAWDAFDEQRGSENDRPDFFEKEQLFLILEFEFGGSDLENSNGTLASLVVAKSILHQVTAALAVAEQELHFEHRDLHWGNVLVKTTKQKRGSFLLNGTAHSLDTRGVLVRIIDYSLSRLEIDGLTVSCDISEDEELFMGQGDYQFDIYRLMRQENGNNWSDYQPHSNVLWLHYLCCKLLSMKYRGPGGRGAKDTRDELTRFRDNVLQYGSATEVLQTSPMFQ
ncbi:uncharacterized protein haspin isoform X3 [Myripristis murdjan]|nr:serine/threonine-protein kinase haspin isoform X3 [Myripristis murdjan]